MSDYNNIKVFYWTNTITNSDSFDDLEATLDENFNNYLVQRMDDYVLTVERFEVHLNNVPYYKAQETFEQIKIYDGVLINPGDELQVIDVTFNSFSLSDTISKLNSLILDIPNAPGNYINIDNGVFRLTNEGIVEFEKSTVNDLQILFPDYLNRILGLEFQNQDPTAAIIRSPIPRWDCGDSFQKIRISSNLPVYSDVVGQGRNNTLTDLSADISISASKDGSYSYTPRGRLIYNPQQRRYLNFTSPAPLNSLRITAEYVDIDNNSFPIQLRRGCSFSLKLGFWLKKTDTNEGKDESE